MDLSIATITETMTAITKEFAEICGYPPPSVQDAVFRAASAVLPSKRAATRHGLQSFVIQTTFVVTGIRSAYLLDAFTLDRLALARFLDILNTQAPSNIAVCYDETTDQAFVLNSALLEARIESEDFPLWVPTSPPFSLVRTLSLKRVYTLNKIE